MKYIVLVGDGMADYPISELGNKTPLQVANTANMDLIAQNGISGTVKTIPDDLPPGSDVANLTVMGYDPKIYYTGRGPLEAGSMGIALKDDDVAYRCNVITVDDKILLDYSSGHISSEESADLISVVKDNLENEEVKFHAGVSYRHLMVHRNGSEKLKCTPPHDIIGKEYAEYLPQGDGQEFIRDLMDKSLSILKDHPVNQRRSELGLNPGNMIWPWGQGKAPRIHSFAEKYGIDGSVVSAVDLVKGIGYYAGLNIIDVPGATGYLDTNYHGKAEYALKSLESMDFVLVHVEAPDEAGHAGDVDLKIRAIEDFDSKVVNTIFREMGKESMILVLPDHLTPISVRTHVHGPVPFAVCGPNIDRDEINSFSEISSKFGSKHFIEGYKLLAYLIGLFNKKSYY